MSELQKALAGLWTAAEACDGGHCPLSFSLLELGLCSPPPHPIQVTKAK